MLFRSTQISAHFDSSGALASIDGTYVPTPRLPTFKPTIPATEAIERAKTMLGTTNWLASDALLVIHAPLEGTPRLAWRFILTASVTEAREIFASALDGEILGNLSAVHDENIATKAYDYFNNLRDINVWRSGGTHFMVDTSKP